MITIFTPAYNRSSYLKILYKSLLDQVVKNFEWLIVDDGSTDDTQNVVESFINEGLISIHYFLQPNSGKHIAINRGLKEAKGTQFFIVDSDDFLTANATKEVQTQFELLVNKNVDTKLFAGIAFNRIYADGKTIGGECSYDILDADYVQYHFKMKHQGDKAEVFYTDVLRQYPFPENGERFCPEALIWHRIGQAYKLRYVNKGIYVCEYLENGLTSKITQVRKGSPLNTCTYYAEVSKNSKVPFDYRLRSIVNFWRFSFYLKGVSSKIKLLSTPYAIFLWPLGFILYIKDNRH